MNMNLTVCTALLSASYSYPPVCSAYLGLLEIGRARMNLFWSFGVSGVQWFRLEARRRLTGILQEN